MVSEPCCYFLASRHSLHLGAQLVLASLLESFLFVFAAVQMIPDNDRRYVRVIVGCGEREVG